LHLASCICLQAAFKETGWGVRAVGMGGAFTARADDASGASWNPGGLTQFQRPEGAFMYERLYTGLEEVNLGTGYASLVLPTYTRRYYALSWANLVSEDQYQENSISFSYARELNEFFYLKPSISVGLNIKYLHHKFKLDEYNQGNPVFKDGTGKGALTGDLGILLRRVRKRRGYSLGLMAKNITRPDVGLKKSDRVPVELRLGSAFYLGHMRFVNWFVMRDVTPSLEVSWRGKDINFHLGWEAWFLRRAIGLRAGGNLKELTLGFSYVNEKLEGLGLELDYSFRFPFEIIQTYGSHRLGLTFRFGESLEEIRKKRIKEEAKLRRLVQEKNRLMEEAKRARALAREAAERAEMEALRRKEVEAMLEEAKRRRLEVVQEERGLVITVRPHFAPDQSEIRALDKPSLDQVVEILNTYSDYKVIIEGHTDSLGSEEYNLELSRERAETVLNYLVSQGVDFSRLVAVGIGEGRPIASNRTPSGRALNRRVEFVVITGE